MTFFPDDPIIILQAIAGAVIGYVAILLAVRMVGLRSFAKMASHDFAVTVAIGSVLASAALSTNTPLVVPLIAVVTLFSLQHLMSSALSKSKSFSNIAQNSPLLLMDGSTILRDNLKASEVSEDELRAKLREANVTRLDQVLAVVFESTGDVSVLHSKEQDNLEDWLIEDIQR